MNFSEYIKIKFNVLNENKDQYGDDIPNDLIPLPTFDKQEWIDMYNFNDDVYKQIMSADWYEVEDFRNIILISSSQIPDFEYEGSLEDVGIEFENNIINRIDPPLYRFNDEDGFYHA